MSSIPYNYGKYVDDSAKLKDQGTIGAGEQINSPSSAGSRGLAQTTQFTKDSTQMKMGQKEGMTPMAESMVEIRSILNRIDGVNAPVQEDEKFNADEWSDNKVDDHGPDLMRLAKGQPIEIPAWDSYYMDMDDGRPHNDQDGNERANDTIGGEVTSAIRGHMDDIQKADFVGKTEQFKPTAETIKYAQNIINSPEFKKAYNSTESAVEEDSGEKIANMAQNMTKDQFMGHADELGLTPEEAAEHYEKMQGGAHVQEDISEKGRIALEKAGFDPMKVKEYMAVFNDHGDTSDIDQMNMDKVGLADAMAMVLASHDVENESTTEDSDELSRLKELSGLEEDDESYGYEWECSNCGTENEFEMSPQERAEYIKNWEENNQDLVADGETGLNALNNLLDDTGAESGMHYGEKCIKCGTEAANPYQPMPEGDEFDIEEDEDFEEVLGPLGFPEDETELFDAEYQGRKVPLNKPMRGDTKKFKVYVKDPKTGNVKKVNFGHGGTSAKRKTMRIRKSNPKARKSFRARHNCANPGPKTKARYWSCRKW